MNKTLMVKCFFIFTYAIINNAFILDLSATTIPHNLLKKHLANISFEENCGQLDDAVYYHAKSTQAIYYFKQNGVRIHVEDAEKEMGLVWDMNFKNINPNVKIIGKDLRKNLTNYISNNSQHVNLSNYSEVWYENIYDNIDLRFYSKGDGTIEYDFILNQGACAEDIAIQFAGIDDFYTNQEGELVLKTPLGELKKSAPYTYQVIDNQEVEVKSFYKKTGNEVRFGLADYDNSSTLVIDPTTLLMSTYLGGLNPYPGIGGMEVNADGIYLAGNLSSSNANKSLDFPTTPGAYIYSAVYTATTTKIGFVSKLSLDGKDLLFSTYFYNKLEETSYQIYDLEVDATGIYFGGATIDLPTTPGVIQPTRPTDQYRAAGFVTKMNLDATDLIYSTYVPGYGQSNVQSLKVINQKAYIAGGTNAANFPTTPGAYNDTSNGESSYVAILNEDASAFDYATYIERHEGATPSQFNAPYSSVYDMEVDASGNIYALGKTRNENFPLTAGALQTEYLDMFAQAFVIKLSPLGNGAADLVFATLAGGDSNMTTFDLELSGNDLYGMIDFYAPIKDPRWAPSEKAYQPSTTTILPGDKDDFIFKFAANTMQLVESTYLNITDYRTNGIEIAEDCGDLYILGHDNGNHAPSQINSYQTSNNGGNDIHLIRMNPDLSEIYSTTYIGGSAGEEGTWKQLRYYNGAMYFSGGTQSTDFPTTEDAYQDALVGTSNPVIGAFSTLRAQAGNALIICPNDNPTMPGVVCGGDNNYTYSWDPVLGLNDPTLEQPTLDANQLPIGETLFTLSVIDGNGATDFDTVRVTVLDNNVLAGAGADRYLCTGDEAKIGTHYYDLASVTYSWSPSTGLDNPNIGNPIASPSVSTTYTLTYTHCDGTQTTDQVFVGIDVDPADVIDVGADPQPCIGGSMTLGTPELENFAYSWDPTDGMDDPTKAQPFIGFVFKEETYTLTMTNVCTGEEATQVLNTTLNADGANAGEDAVSCPNTNFVIGNPPNPNYTSYQWAFVDGGISGSITNATTANPTVNISTAGSHEITLTTMSAACGTSTDTMIAIIIDDTPIPNAGPDQDVCVNYPNNLNTYPPVQIGTPGDEAFTYAWSPTTGLDDPILAEPTATISQTTTYTLTVTGICTGNQATDQITLTVPTTVPLAEAYEDDGINDGPDETTICEQPWGGDYIGMDGRVGVVYSWSPQTRLFEYMLDYEGLDAPSVLAKPYVNTTYYLTAQDTCSGKISIDTILVIVDGTLCTPPDPNDPASAPVADAGDDEVIICEGEDLQIGTPANPNPALTYEWFPTTDLDNPNIAEPTVQSPTNDRSYTLTVTNTNTGAKARDIITVRVRPAPLASAGTSPLTFDCGADISNVQLGPANGATQFENSDWDITWTPTIGLSDPNALRPILNGPDVSNAYSVTVVDKITGCSSTAFMTIQFNDNFADAGSDKTICPGETVQIGTSEPPNTSSNFVFYQYNWEPSESLSAPNLARPDASPLETTLYTVNVTKLVYSSSFQFISSCQQSSSVTVNVTETTTEVADAGADHRGLCPTDADVTIGSNSNESPNATYSWSPSTGLSNATIPDPVVDISTLASGENPFTLTVTDVASGCTSTDDVVIEINATAPATASVDPTATGCEGEPVEITGVSYPADYLINWTSTDDPNLDFFGPADSDAPVAFVQSTAMTYTMNVTDQCGGSAATADVTISPVAAPSIDAMGTYGIVCPGGPLALNGVSTTGATTFSWEPASAVDNANIEQPNFIGTTTTILKLTIGNGGCEVSDQVEIIVDVPEADAGSDQITCTGTPVTIGTTGDVANYDYTWTIVTGPGPLPGITNTPQIDVDPTATTEYQVSVVHKTTGCPAVLDSVIVTIPAGTPTANAGIDISKCPNDPAVNIGSTAVDGVEYQWTPIDGLSNATKADPIACPDATTIYTVRATNICNGTFTEDQVTVTINAVPNADAGADVEACEGESLVLGGTDEGHTYSWSPNLYLDNANIANPTLTVPDTKSNSTSVLTYTVSVDNGSGCIAMDQVKINTHPVPELNYTNAIVCQGSGGTVLGDANSISGYDGNYNILWSPKGGLSDPTIANPIANPKSDLIYTIRIYTEDGCFTSQEVKVQKEDYTPYPEASSSCEGGNGYVTVNKLDGASYSWTGPNGFTSTSRSNDLSNLTANDFGTYTVTITSKNDCVYTESTEMVNFCRASANCDIAIDNFTVSNCIYNDTEQKSEATIDVTVSWGAGAPTGERIRVTAGVDEVFIDAPNISSPQTVQVTVPADGNSGGLAAEFESSTSCVVVETYTAPNPCNCTLDASVFADNCNDNGNNTFTANWNLNIEVSEIPDDQISYQRNSEPIQDYTIVGNSGTIQIFNIPADGGAYDTLRVYLKNDVSCGDTIIIKRPAPCPTPVATCGVVSNGDFEAGDFPGNGTLTPFAGGTRVDFADQTPDQWTQATNNGGNYWIESPTANSGNKYVYAFSSGTTTGGTDACNQYSLNNLTGNTTYDICVQVADARADGLSSGLAIEVQQIGGGFEYGNFEIADNPAWDDNALTTIPWKSYCYGFTTGAGITEATIWLSASTEVGTASTSYIVIDDMCVKNKNNIPTSNATGDICNAVANTEIGGTVWEDWNYNGAMDENSLIGTQGVQVNLYDDCGNATQTTFTDSNGNYVFTGLTEGTPYRVEFELPESVACWAKPTLSGADNGTTVQFVETGNCANLGIANPSDYCQEDPLVALSCFVAGTASGGGALEAFVSLDYSSSGTSPTINKDAETQGIGSVWGAAYQKSTKNLYTASFLKRHIGFLGSPGLIFNLDYNTTPATVANSLNLENYSPSNIGDPISGGINISLGTVDRSSGSDYTLGATPSVASTDLDAFGKVGTISYGDLDITEDGNTIWAVNLFQKGLISIDVSTGSFGTVNQYLLNTMSGVPSCSNGEIRPFGLEFHKGVGYLGVVCDASISQNNSDLIGYILSFDPNNMTQGFATVLTIDFSQYVVGHVVTDMKAWVDNWAQTGYNTSDGAAESLRHIWMQPIISDIAFDETGSLIVGVMDRFTHQLAYLQNFPVSGGGASPNTDIRSAGTIIRACNINGNFEIENGTNCGNNFFDGIGFNNGAGVYYHLKSGDGTPTAAGGGLLSLMGKNELIFPLADPYNPPNYPSSLPDASTFFTQGLHWVNHTDGSHDDWAVLIGQGMAGQSSKGTGLGDPEAICELPPLEIGNYVWEDLDADGIQDACEPPMEGVFIVLYKKINGFTAFVDSTRTDANGHYYFKELDGNRDTLQTGVEYTITVGQLAQYKPETERLTYNGKLYALTDPNVGNNINIDSDGIPYPEIVSTFTDYPSATFTIDDPGCIDHSIDFGFYPTCEMTATLTQTCNDNNTGGDTNDDYIVFSFDVSNTYAGASNQYQVIYDGNVIAEATYGSTATIEYTTTAQTTRFLADNASTYTFTIQDKDDTTCNEELISTPVDHCSSCPPPVCLPVSINKKWESGTN